jgi:DNA-directed RNA polymerase I subunit RPA1
MGTVDKAQYGASGYGMVHSVYELYGPETAGILLTCLGRLFTRYLQMIGFTCRMDDLIIKAKHFSTTEFQWPPVRAWHNRK